MTNQQPADFSFDLYPGLDRELEDIYARNVASGTATPEALARVGLAGAVGNVLPQKPNTLHISPEAQAWAEKELDLDAIHNWHRYGDVNLDTSLLYVHTPADDPEDGGYTDVNREHFSEKIEKLYQAEKALEASGEITPDGENIGKAMQLVVVPWKAFRDNLDHLPEFIASLRGVQDEYGQLNGDEDYPGDYFNERLLKAMRDGTPMYRNPIAGHVYTTTTSMPVAPDWISAAEYLDYRINKDGDWGLMLAQTSKTAGIKRLVEGPAEERSPNALTNHGNDTFMLADQNVGQMGVFEWLSTTLQSMHPSELSPTDAGWLLANRLDVGGDPYVLYGFWRDGRVGSSLRAADRRYDYVRPRLAVM